jgi:hypothetical protein
MAIGSGQLSFGTINTEISWASTRANTYFVNAGPTGATYMNYTTQSLYGYYAMRVFPLLSAFDYNDGNFDLIVDQDTCEAGFVSTPPDSNKADVSVSWTIIVDYFDAFNNSFGFYSTTVASGNTSGSSSDTFLCYVPGLCQILSFDCAGNPSPFTSGTTSTTGQSIFYIGFFQNTSRFKFYTCGCP